MTTGAERPPRTAAEPQRNTAAQPQRSAPAEPERSTPQEPWPVRVVSQKITAWIARLGWVWVDGG